MKSSLLLASLCLASAAAANPIDPTRAPVFDGTLTQLAPPSERSVSSPTPFDLYVLAQSWQPEFCHGKTKQFPGCAHPQEYWAKHFTMHGLWPERSQGAPPGFCTTETFDPKLIEDAIGMKLLMKYWPDVKEKSDSPTYSDFWKHEWTRHGTCSGLSQVSYFSHAMDLIRNGTAPTPVIVQNNTGSAVPVDALRQAFVKPVVLKCMHGNILSQVFSCWEKDATNLPVAQCTCPEHVIKEDTCTGESIHIPVFPEPPTV